MDDVEHEMSEEQRKQEEEEEFGERKTTRKHDLRNEANRKDFKHEMTHLLLLPQLVQTLSTERAIGGLSQGN